MEQLTKNELQALLEFTGVLRGKTNKESGVILELSARTVQKHLEHIYQKMGAESRTCYSSESLRDRLHTSKQTSMFSQSLLAY